MDDLLHNVIINLRGIVAAQFILQPQNRLFVKELLQMHFNVVVRKLVLLMQAGDILTEQLNDATGAPFYNLLYIPQTRVYKKVTPTYITLQYKSCSKEFRIEYMADICFWPLYMFVHVDETGFQFHKLNRSIWLH